MDLASVGKLVAVLGAVILLSGLLLIAMGRGVAWHLPGDLSFRVGQAQVSLPIVTSIVISIVLTVVLNFIARR